jgi:hypothetical protein
VKKSAKKKEPMTGSDACVYMHTALRKACDSKITSSVYNMVHLVKVEPHKYDPWRFFGQLVADRLNNGEKPWSAVVGAHAELENKFLDLLYPDVGRKPDDVPREATTWLYAFSCAMCCFSKRDWEGMAAYLKEEE